MEFILDPDDRRMARIFTPSELEELRNMAKCHINSTINEDLWDFVEPFRIVCLYMWPKFAEIIAETEILKKWPKIFRNSGQICNADQNYIIFSAIFDFRISVSAIISVNFGHVYSMFIDKKSRYNVPLLTKSNSV
jgi:hypothetical protein